MRELPLACSLDAPALADRVAEMRAIGREAFVAAEPDGAVGESVHVLRFRAGADTRARLERIVAAEAQCCAFLSLRLDEDGGGDGDDDLDEDGDGDGDTGSLRLTVAAPGGAEPVVAALIEAFATPPET